MKFRKKPVVIEAFQYLPDSDGYFASPEWCQDGMSDVEVMRPPYVRCVQIRTLEGTMTANIGDWVIKGIKGELYPCKPDIFEATYERVD